MGNFYTNYTLRGPSLESVADALRGRNAIVSRSKNTCVVVFDEASEQDQEVIGKLGAQLSSTWSCPVLAVLNHDDDILWYDLYVNGSLSDRYDSSPGYFDADAEPAPPIGGDAQKLCTAFGATDVETIESVLRRSSYDDDGYAFASERHADLVRALGLPQFAVGTAYSSLERNEYPEGLSPNDVVKTT